MSSKHVMGGQRQTNTVTPISDYRTGSEHEAEQEEEDSGHDMGLAIKLIVGVFGFFIIAVTATFMYVNSSNGSPKRPRLNLTAARPNTAYEQPSTGRGGFQQTQQQAAASSLADLNLPGVTNSSRAKLQSVNVPADMGVNIPATPVVSPVTTDVVVVLGDLEETIAALTVAVKRLGDENRRAALNNDELLGAVKLLKKTTKEVSRLKKAPVSTRKRPSAVSQLQNKQSQPSVFTKHEYTIKAKARTRTWLGKKSDESFVLEIKVGSSVPGLGKVISIYHDPGTRVTTVKTASAEIRG